MWVFSKLLVLVLASCLLACAGYGIGGGLSYTDASGASYSGNLTVTKFSDGKTVVAPGKQ